MTMLTRIEVDCATGETVEVELTSKEEAAVVAERAATAKAVAEAVAPLTAEEKVEALTALLVEKGVATEAEVAQKLERVEVVAEVKPR